MKVRHEYKHSLNYADYILLRDRLSRTMRRDSHADEKGQYKVRSLYFDTPGDRALTEKINGVDRREKFRLRRYIGTDNYIALEKKSKRNGLCCKHACRLSREKTQLLLSGNIEWMLLENSQLTRELYVKIRSELLRPKTIVEYIREAFIYPAGNVRITLDHDIRSGLLSTDFLNDDIPLIKAGEEMVLLEVKYDQFIPGHIVSLLQLGNRRASACSKYAICRNYG
jgi:hypothetical protein